MVLTSVRMNPVVHENKKEDDLFKLLKCVGLKGRLKVHLGKVTD